MSADKKQTKEDEKDKSVESTTAQYLVETMKQLQEEAENLKLELRKTRFSPGKIGTMFLIPGALSIVAAILADSQILAFVGLGLTFWGALFFLSRPVRYVRSSLLDSIAVSSYSTIDRMIKDLKFEGKGYYIPPFPKETILPEYLKESLKGLKDMVVFIAADGTIGLPSVEELAKSMFLVRNPNGMCVVPPGLGLLTQFEKELGQDIRELELSELCDTLTKLILENLQLAKKVEIEMEEDEVRLRISDSIYKNLYSADKNLRSVYLLGCPLVSALACAIAKATGKIVRIEESSTSSDGMLIEVVYRFIGVWKMEKACGKN